VRRSCRLAVLAWGLAPALTLVMVAGCASTTPAGRGPRDATPTPEVRPPRADGRDAQATVNEEAARALEAARVAADAGDVDGAAQSTRSIFSAYPQAPAALGAAELHLRIVAARRDIAAYAAALGEVGAYLDGEASRLRVVGGGGGDARERRLERLRDEIATEQQRLECHQAMELLHGSPLDAAVALEAFAARHPQSPDAAKALHNAAVGYDAAREPRKAAAARESLLRRYPASELAPGAALALASSHAAAGDHAGAEAAYAAYLERFPKGAQRCLALHNAGAEADLAGKSIAAAKHYVDFGSDPACAKEDAITAAKLLYRAAALFEAAKRRGEEKAALQRLVALPGVNDAAVKACVEEAKARLDGIR
jgi:TolA-binding protein